LWVASRLACAIFGAAACVELSDAGTEGGKCFTDGECNEGLICTVERICRRPAEGSAKPCEDKRPGDACEDESGDNGECAHGLDEKLYCAMPCLAPGDICPQGTCYAADDNLFLCSERGNVAPGFNCYQWNECYEGNQCYYEHPGDDQGWCATICGGAGDTDTCIEGHACEDTGRGYWACFSQE
jgi:hypothetical protein